MAVQVLATDERIPVHLHDGEDEVFFVHKGTGTAFLNEDSAAIGEGTVVFIPKGTWHGFHNAGVGSLELVWLIYPPHFMELFRQLSTTTWNSLSPEQRADTLAKYGNRIRQ